MDTTIAMAVWRKQRDTAYLRKDKESHTTVRIHTLRVGVDIDNR